ASAAKRPLSVPGFGACSLLSPVPGSRRAIALMACRALSPAPWRITVRAAGRAQSARLGVPIGRRREKSPEAAAAPEVVVRNDEIGRRPACNEATLRLVAQDRDELGAIVGLAAQGFVRDDDRGSRHGGRRDAIEHILWNGDAVECGPGIVPVIDRNRSPVQARVV